MILAWASPFNSYLPPELFKSSQKHQIWTTYGQGHNNLDLSREPSWTPAGGALFHKSKMAAIQIGVIS